MAGGKIRVLVIDDSAFARKTLREALSADPRFEVVGIARDGLEGLERIAELEPDVVTLDLLMPNLDGMGVLRALPLAKDRAPRVVIVTTADDDSELAVAALQAGAVDLVHKPTALATDRLSELAGELCDKVAAAASARARLPSTPSLPAFVPQAPLAGTKSIVVIGASTGGPQAITRLLKGLPDTFPVPIVIVLHIPPGYIAAFANRLDADCAIEVREGSDGLVLRAGVAILAPAGIHTKIVRRGGQLIMTLDREPMTGAHRPSVDALFASLASGSARDVLAVVLTGMGDDGLIGARALHAAGATILIESEASCVVYGMPRCVEEAGLAAGEAPIETMAQKILGSL